MSYDYAELKGKKYTYSREYWYLYLKDGEIRLVSKSSTHHFLRFEQVHNFLYERYILVHPRRRVIIYLKNFDLVMRYYIMAVKYQPVLKDAINITIKNIKKTTTPVTHTVKEKETSCMVLNFINYRDMLYYLGTDEVESEEDAISLMERFGGTHASKGFSGHLKDIFFSDIKQDESELTQVSVLKCLTTFGSLSSIVGVQTGEEFKDVHSYDFSSAFISWLLYDKFPTTFKACKSLKSKQGYVHLVKMRFHNLKIKRTNFRTLSCVKATDKTKVHTLFNTRVCDAEEFTYAFFYELEMPVINLSYTYDSVEIVECWESKVEYLPEEFRQKVLSFAKDKQDKKKSGQSYKAYKVVLNRVWGLLVTTHDRNGLTVPMYKGMPFAWGYYVIALQKHLMARIIKEVGEKNIVHMHTDSIKTTVSIDEFVHKLNTSRPLQYDIGLLEKEGIYEKIYYFSAVRCKYIFNKKLGMKHGGIRKEDCDRFLEGKKYRDIRSNSKIQITKSEYLAIVGEKTEIVREYTECLVSEDKKYDRKNV